MTAKEEKFTPGPWKVTDIYSSRVKRVTCYDIESEDCPYWVAQVQHGPEGRANALLIASSPDLYAALLEAQRLLSLCEFQEPEDLAALDKIDAALGKAVHDAI